MANIKEHIKTETGLLTGYSLDIRDYPIEMVLTYFIIFLVSGGHLLC